jgi:hypothetical protein
MGGSAWSKEIDDPAIGSETDPGGALAGGAPRFVHRRLGRATEPYRLPSARNPRRPNLAIAGRVEEANYGR